MQPSTYVWLLALCLAGFTGSATAQTPVDCAASHIRIQIPGNFTCSEFAASSDRRNLILSSTSNLYGTASDGMGLSLQMSRIVSGDGYFHTWTVSEDAIRRIQEFNNRTKAATSWSAMHRVDAVTYVAEFESGNAHCFGFVHGGGPTPGGFGFITRGYFCPAGKAVTGEEEQALLAKIDTSR